MAASLKISIIMVTFNPGDDLIETLESVSMQDYPDLELILVDGGSTDGTLELLRNSNRLNNWISEPDNGIYDAMNKGMRLAQGDYITFLNAGDRYTGPEVIRSLFSGLTGTMPHLIYGDVILEWDRSGRTTYQRSMEFTRENLLRYTTQVVCHQSLFIRRDIAPLYDTRFKFKGELNWYFDMVENIPDLATIYKPVPVVIYNTSGAGQRHFWSNFREMVGIVRERYGWGALLKYNYLLIFFLKLFYRLQWRKPKTN